MFHTSHQELNTSERRNITMSKSTTKVTKHFTACASLAAISVKLRELDIFGPIRKRMHIDQKTVKHTPTDKLYDGFISLLAGA